MLDVIHKPKACPKVAFCANPKTAPEDKNPISKAGERATLLKATAVAGLGVGVRLLYEIMIDGDFLFEDFFNWGQRIADKNKKGLENGLESGMERGLEKGSNNLIRTLGITGALILGFVGVVAAIYTLFKSPNIAYQGKVNAFVKGKDMDVYTKSNGVEKELYNQMVEKAKNATPEEKAVLAKQYLKLKAAKNEVPDSIKTR